MEEDLSVSIVLDNQRTLWLTEISRAAFEDQALDDVGGDGGMFVVLEDSAQGTFEVLAKAVSKWSGEVLLDLFARSMMRGARLRSV
jgi:hypothetical protein